MTIPELQLWIDQNPSLAFVVIIFVSVLGFFAARFIIARGLVYLAKRTETKYDDIVVEHLHPFRVAWLAPLIVILSFDDLVPAYQILIEKIALFLILWVVAVTINALLNAFNELYESSPSFSGVSIQGYLDIVKILILIVSVILSISIFTGESPIVYLTGLGVGNS